MEEAQLQLGLVTKKPADFAVDKILQRKKSHSLVDWASLYFETQVVGSPQKTVAAKKQDLSKFLSFFGTRVGHEHLDGWTPAVTKQFQTELMTRVSSSTGETLKATSINRICATLRHFASWIHKQRAFLAGHPFEGVKDIQTDEPSWNGLTDIQIMRLRSACEQREKLCTKDNQNPRLETAVFYVLLYTGLRESELISLNRHQYYHKGFHDVKRKGKRISTKVPCPANARYKLQDYLEGASNEKDGPLFTSRYERRLKPNDVARICNRIAKQANAYLPPEEHIHLTPHMLRHTFLKRVADEHGVHVAQQMSGNISMKEVFRYTKPSIDEMENCAEKISLRL